MQLSNKQKASLAFAAAAVAGYSYIPSLCGKAKYFSMVGEKDKNLYLTFDDGPSAEYTGKLLDLLKEYDVKASFFVVARSAQAHPDLIKRMKEEGHLIGLHSLEHKSAMVQTPMYTNREFKKSMKIMADLHVDVRHYRPPWGHVNLFTLMNLKKYNLKKVIWHVMAEDWEADTSDEEIQYKLLKRTGKGDVICLHDGRGKSPDAPERTIAALEKTIPIWLEEGYQFKLLDQKHEQ